MRIHYIETAVYILRIKHEYFCSRNGYDSLLEINLIASNLGCCIMSDLEVLWLIRDEYIGLSMLYVSSSESNVYTLTSWVTIYSG